MASVTSSNKLTSRFGIISVSDANRYYDAPKGLSAPMLVSPRLGFLWIPMIIIGALFSSTSLAQRRSKLPLRFLARGTAIYSSFSGSQSEYLIQITDLNHKPYYARLLYKHRLSHPEIPNNLIDSGELHSLWLIRSKECDESYRTLATAWIPGPYGTFQIWDGLHFVSEISRPVITDDEVVPCYLLPPEGIRWRKKGIRVD